MRAWGMLLLLALAPAARAGEVDRVCFTPGEACLPVITREIGAARQQILVQAYNFTSPEIVRALADARRRGVDVRVVLDRSNACKDSEPDCEKKGAIAAETLAIAKVPVLIDRKHAIAHNKVMVIDGHTVLTGSYNFTRAAEEKNAENLVVIRGADTASAYADNWHRHSAHSDPVPR